MTIAMKKYENVIFKTGSSIKYTSGNTKTYRFFLFNMVFKITVLGCCQICFFDLHIWNSYVIHRNLELRLFNLQWSSFYNHDFNTTQKNREFSLERVGTRCRVRYLVGKCGLYICTKQLLPITSSLCAIAIEYTTYSNTFIYSPVIIFQEDFYWRRTKVTSKYFPFQGRTLKVVFGKNKCYFHLDFPEQLPNTKNR